MVFQDGAEIDIPSGGLSSALADEARGADFIAFAPAGTIFDPFALARWAEGFQRFPGEDRLWRWRLSLRGWTRMAARLSGVRL